jgi:hypothetical protein
MSPKNGRNYNSDLPLASIPESKESILEENSVWGGTVNKLGVLKSAESN